MNTSWHANLKNKLLKCAKLDQPEIVAEKYAHAFSDDYGSHFDEEAAVLDIIALEEMSHEQPIDLTIYRKEEKGQIYTHIKLYQLNDHHTLSHILPILDNFGITVISENTFEVTINETESFYLSDFKVKFSKDIEFDDSTTKSFHDALIKTINNECENDGFNKLSLYAKLNWHEINVMRAYAKYSHQALFQLSQSYIEKVMYNYPDIARLLLALFLQKNDLNTFSNQEDSTNTIESEIKTKIDEVLSLDDDRILRRYWHLINATLRTNYFQTNDDGSWKNYLSLKIDSEKVPELPVPKPAYEFFVYSARFEGIHLRSSKIARGGIRWSDRVEDYRTEVLGLMKAQRVKNTIIVPSGAKGGFVVKRAHLIKDRNELREEVTECYKLFISGLLDLTDNIVNDKIIPPHQVRCHDEADTYLVVAADKGTATFSDIANKVASSYKFWLGDAFASGGSQGYDHKAVGITARGAWESIKRHLIELDIDLQKTPITVAGVGDMSGDVFGNGLLYSDNLKLIAAFDHRHIFIDPTPDPKKSFAERKRLFEKPGSTWEDYEKTTISMGGEVYPRNLKSITISAEAKEALGADKLTLTPNELIQCILKAPVDLFYNGGIGTYIKASEEHHDSVGDKANQLVRVNACDLRCKIVGEGGNLGLTHLARIEFAQNGGLVNADFVDNSAGVDCSDHEVNIKILLNEEVTNNKMTVAERNTMLANLQDEVANLVLKSNYYQALVMSYSSYHAAAYADLYQSHIEKLESCAGLSRTVEYLPEDKVLIERKSQGKGLTRPELAVLLAYSKLHMKQEILNSDLHNNNFANTIVKSAFPQSIRVKYANQISNHYLQKEINATQISNYILNKMGMTFPYRIQNETGASLADVSLAFLVASHLYDSDKLQAELDIANNKTPVKVQYELLHLERQLLNIATRWFLRNGRLHTHDTKKLVEDYKPKIETLIKIIPDLVVGDSKTNEERIIKQLKKIGLNDSTAKRIAISRSIFAALDIIEIAESNAIDLTVAAKSYYKASSEFNLVWLRDKLIKDKRTGLWNSLSRLSIRESLDNIQKRITSLALSIQPVDCMGEDPVTIWASRHKQAFARWTEVQNRASESNSDDYKLLFIALHELNHILDSIATTEEQLKTYSSLAPETEEFDEFVKDDLLSPSKTPA